MAAIYRKGSSPVYYAQWTVYCSETGKWKKRQKSTGAHDAEAALEQANDWQRKADAVAALSGARRRGASRSVGMDMPRMSEREREILEAAQSEDPGRDPRRKAALWVEFVEDTLARQENATTRDSYRLCLDRWAIWCAGQGRSLRFLEDGDSDLAERWRDGMLAEGLRAKRVNFHLAAVGLIYERARKRGLLPANPFADVLRVRTAPTRDNLPARPFTDEQMAALPLAPYRVALASSHHADAWTAGMAEEWEVLIRLAGVTGQRLMDAVMMVWSEIDIDAGVIDYLPRKTAKHSRRIAFPLRLWPDAWARLRAWRDASLHGSETGRVFPLVAAKGDSSPVWPSKAFLRIMEAAGITREVARAGEGRGRTRHTHSFHSLRHTANTRAAARGIPAEIRKELFGHSTVEMNRVYTHWQPDVLEELLKKR